MVKKHTHITTKKDSYTPEPSFATAATLPKGVSIAASLNFVFAGFESVLCLDETNHWGPVYEKAKPTESWEETAHRGAYENTGMRIGDLHLVGYIETFNEDRSSKSSVNRKSIIPITYSFVTNEVEDWKPTGKKKGEVFSPTHTREALKENENDSKTLAIYEHILGILKKDLQVTYQFIPGKMLDDVLVTSVMTFCKNKKEEFCIVKDSSETFYSLPGGGRSLNETPMECSKRELLEEALVESKHEEVLGTILVSFNRGSVCVAKMQQVRYLSDADIIHKFVPHNNGFETDDRQFIPFNELGTKVKQLGYPTGLAILNYLAKKNIA